MEIENIPLIFIERLSDLERISAVLAKETAIGVDLEADSMFHYREKVCLIQISTSSKNILIDPLAVKDLSALAPIFAEPGIRKIFHGADYDIRSLHRDFGIEISSLFDTQIAAAFLGIKETGLASLLKDRFNVTVEKKYQKKDWSRRPLDEAMLDYAVRDSFYLLPLASLLEKELRSKGLLFCVEEECEGLCKVRAATDDSQHLFLKYKGAGKLDPMSLTVLEAVLQFRRQRAEKMDRPPFKVLGNTQVDKIVKEKPKSIPELLGKKCLTNKQIKNFGPALARKIDKVLALPEKSLLLYPRKAGLRLSPKIAHRVRTLKRWRDQRAAEMGIDPALICPNSQIKSLATLQPKTQNDLKEIKIMRNWQKKLFGQEICAILE